MRLNSEQVRTLFNYMDDVDVVYINECEDLDHSEFCLIFTTAHNGTKQHLSPNGSISE